MKKSSCFKFATLAAPVPRPVPWWKSSAGDPWATARWRWSLQPSAKGRQQIWKNSDLEDLHLCKPLHFWMIFFKFYWSYWKAAVSCLIMFFMFFWGGFSYRNLSVDRCVAVVTQRIMLWMFPQFLKSPSRQPSWTILHHLCHSRSFKGAGLHTMLPWRKCCFDHKTSVLEQLEMKEPVIARKKHADKWNFGNSVFGGRFIPEARRKTLEKRRRKTTILQPPDAWPRLVYFLATYEAFVCERKRIIFTLGD